MLQNLKAKLKYLYHSFNTIALSKGIIFAKNANFLQKMLTSAKLRGLGTKKYIFWNSDVFVLAYQISSF